MRSKGKSVYLKTKEIELIWLLAYPLEEIAYQKGEEKKQITRVEIDKLLKKIDRQGLDLIEPVKFTTLDKKLKDLKNLSKVIDVLIEKYENPEFKKLKKLDYLDYLTKLQKLTEEPKEEYSYSTDYNTQDNT